MHFYKALKWISVQEKQRIVIQQNNKKKKKKKDRRAQFIEELKNSVF